MENKYKIDDKLKAFIVLLGMFGFSFGYMAGIIMERFFG